MGGIEAQIAEARALAETAQTQIASIHNTFDERLKNAELHVVSSTHTLKELTDKLDELAQAARDAWYHTFWVYADVVSHVALFDAPPPKGNIVSRIAPGFTVLLLGEMLKTPSGPAMRVRNVSSTGEISDAWLLLQDDKGTVLVTNFRV